MNYEQMAFIAKYGGTLFFFMFFICVLLYVFSPGGKKRAKEAANIIMTKDDTPIIDNTHKSEDLS